MTLLRHIIDACWFVGGLSALALLGLKWVDQDPGALKGQAVPGIWLAVPATVFFLTCIIGPATCVWGGVMYGRAVCRLKFGKGPPLDPVKDLVWIQAFYGAVSLLFTVLGLLIAVAWLRKVWRRKD